MSRGIRWATSVARRRPDLLARPWPGLDDGRTRAIAEMKVDDEKDARVVARLTELVHESARDEWDKRRCSGVVDGMRCTRPATLRVLRDGSRVCDRHIPAGLHTWPVA
jgi:hypothetical protein